MSLIVMCLLPKWQISWRGVRWHFFAPVGTYRCVRFVSSECAVSLAVSALTGEFLSCIFHWFGVQGTDETNWWKIWRRYSLSKHSLRSFVEKKKRPLFNFCCFNSKELFAKTSLRCGDSMGIFATRPKYSNCLDNNVDDNGDASNCCNMNLFGIRLM